MPGTQLWLLNACAVMRPQPFMRCMEGDLSGKRNESVHLWLKMGQGDGVITDIAIQKAPNDHGNPVVAKVPPGW